MGVQANRPIPGLPASVADPPRDAPRLVPHTCHNPSEPADLAMRVEPSSRLAMQKVDGSGPFIRFERPPGNGGFLLLGSAIARARNHASDGPHQIWSDHGKLTAAILGRVWSRCWLADSWSLAASRRRPVRSGCRSGLGVSWRRPSSIKGPTVCRRSTGRFPRRRAGWLPRRATASIVVGWAGEPHCPGLARAPDLVVDRALNGRSCPGRGEREAEVFSAVSAGRRALSE